MIRPVPSILKQTGQEHDMKVFNSILLASVALVAGQAMAAENPTIARPRCV
jgi:hypothetical protein